MTAADTPAPTRHLPLWPLALLAGLLPAAASLIALALYTQHTGVWCNPFVDECVSISRMARTGAANPIFRALVLPGAALQALTWLLLAQALVTLGPVRRQAVWMAMLGVIGALALIVYGSYLGVEGDIYRWLRRRGTLTYFGCSYLALLLFARMLQQLRRGGQIGLPRGPWVLMLALLGFLALLALLHGFAALANLELLKDRLENLTEWWGSLAMTLLLVAIALIWRRWGVCATVVMLGRNR
jgi:hypothetical protein